MPHESQQQNENIPLVLVPVSADDVARRKRRITLTVWAVAIALIATSGLLYKHWMDPIHARESYDSGVRLLAVARYDQAILSFDRTISLRPENVDAYMMRGRAYLGLSKNDEAIRDFSHVIELRPSDAEVMVQRGLTYLELKDLQAALDDANHAIAADPKSARAYNLRGLAIRAMGDPQKALPDFTKAVELVPNEDNYYQRGATYQILGDHRSAIADFDHVIAIKPDGAPGYFARAESRRAVGDLKGAAADHLQGRIIDGR